MSYHLSDYWTQEEEDELIYLYENHTQRFIFKSFKGRKSAGTIGRAIKRLKEYEVISSKQRLTYPIRLQNDKHAEWLEKLDTTESQRRSTERKYYLERAQLLFGI